MTGNPEVLPSWPAGHIILDSEAATLWALLGATATDGGLWPEQLFTRMSAQTYSAQTTLQNDTVFTFAGVASAAYVFMIDGQYVTNATALFKIAWTGPTGAGGTWHDGGFPTSVTASSSGSVNMGTTAVFGSTHTLGTNGSNTAFHGAGYITIGATAGNVTFQHAQNVSNGSGGATTGMLAGSWLSVKRVL